jgi:Fe-S cluster biogenesis protein NfuA
VSDPAPDDEVLGALGPLLDRLEDLLGEVDEMDEAVRDRVFGLLDGVDELHRLAITRLAAHLDDEVPRLHEADPAIGWLFDAYGVGVDDTDAASVALDEIRPYIHGHGGEVQVLGVRHGVVRVQLSGTCSGCTAAAQTLRDGVEKALRDHLPGFVAMEVEPDDGAASHPPPRPVPVEITARPA